MRFVEFTRDMNMQRRADLQNIGRVVGSYDGELLRQRQMINNVDSRLRDATAVDR